MEAEKLLARLNPKTSAMETGSTGFDPLTPAQIAHAVAYIPDKYAASMLVMKGTGNYRGLAELHRYVYGKVWEIAEIEKWRSTSTVIELVVNRLVETALAEEFLVALCPRCKGRCDLFRRDRVVEKCPTCKGTGHKRMSERARARSCEIEWKNWCRRWRRRYKIVRGILGEMDNTAREALRKAMR